MELAGRRVAILAEKDYEDPELWYPYYRFQEAGARVTVVGSGSASTFLSKHGYPVKVDTNADQVNAGDFDAVVPSVRGRAWASRAAPATGMSSSPDSSDSESRPSRTPCPVDRARHSSRIPTGYALRST